MTVNFSPSQLSLVLFGSFVAAAVATLWYARRPAIRSRGASVLVIFAWLMPVLGPLCLLIFLAAAKSDRPRSTELDEAARP